MIFDDRERFVMLLTACAETFGRAMSEAMLEGYWIGLNDLPLESVERAVEHGIRSSKFMPSVAELRDLSGAQSVEDRALIAFTALKRAVSNVGHYRSIQFDDPAITATIRALGGWDRVTGLESEEFNKWFRKDFERTYAVFCRRGVSAEEAQPLLGFHDTHNIGHGFKDKPEHIHLVTTGLEPTKMLESNPFMKLLASIDEEER